MADIESMKRRALAVLEPPKRQDLSAWIESEMVLPDGVTALPGKVRLWPFQREIADAMGDPDVERVSVVKPVRVGYTTLLTSTIGSFIGNDPSPILAVLPTEDDCRDYMVSDIEPIFEATPQLARALGEDGDDSGRNTILAKRFAGGFLKVVAAKSPRNLRRHNVRVLIEDEVDAFEMTKEGPPDVLAEKRTLSYPNRKIVKGSTPIFTETSAILRAYESSDQRIYECPCPECGEFHEIMWKHIQWNRDEDGRHRPETAYFLCPSCGSVVKERFKTEMVANGRWRALAPHVVGHAGFRLNALISLHANASWPKLVQEFLDAQHVPELLQVFTNTILGQGWRTGGEAIDEEALREGAEDFSLDLVPEEVLAMTVGVDVQDDRLELGVLGWTEDGQMLTLWTHVIDGRYDDDETWRELDEVYAMRFPHALGGTIGFDAMAVDAGSGTHMPHVLKFTIPRLKRRVFAIKGEDGISRPMVVRGTSKQSAGRLWIVGSDAIKKDLFDRIAMTLRREEGVTRRLVRFSRTLPPHWYEQLASERLVVRYMHGKPIFRFERVAGRRAEALDQVVYGIAARKLFAVDWDRRRAEVSVKEAGPEPVVKRERKKRSDWVGAKRGSWL